MNYRPFGCTSLTLSELCLGTMHFGWSTDEPTSGAILDAFHDSGGTYVQAVSASRDAVNAQALSAFSEIVVGRWHTRRGVARRELVLGTQWTPPTGRGTPGVTEEVRATMEESLRRLQTDYLDILVVRWPDGGAPEALRTALDAIVRRGLVRYVVLANAPSWRVVELMRDGLAQVHCRFEGVQVDYSLLARTGLEPELARVCDAHRLAVIARSPLAGGALSGSQGLRPARRDWLAVRYADSCRSRVSFVLHEIARERGESTAQVALAWVLHNRQVASAILGVNAVGQLHELVRAAALTLSAPELERLHAASAAQQVLMPPRGAPGVRASATAAAAAERRPMAWSAAFPPRWNRPVCP
ncbi:aldo/keto reductase [Opitutus sp. ER46]|uniref:aldo/keto reductase n=1 Tax=Opitutus sp. ER46 TaxID=2161864 RepID=UPI000D2F6C67|nr:aldo/keto reductase [Opitutus sp. ER46]